MIKEPSQKAERRSRATPSRLLGHVYRLALLECLDHHGEAIPLAEAAEWVASTLEDEGVEDVDAETVKRIYLSLYHSHIPKLEAHDVIEYRQEEDRVALREADELMSYRRMCSTVASMN